MIQKIGFVLFLIGGAGMDSPDRTIPVMMVLTGLLILTISAIKEMRSNMEYRVEYENVAEYSVLEKYRKNIKEKSLAQTPTKAMRKAK